MFSNICMESRDKNRGDTNIWTLLLWESMQGRKLTDTYHFASEKFVIFLKDQFHFLEKKALCKKRSIWLKCHIHI